MQSVWAEKKEVKETGQSNVQLSDLKELVTRCNATLDALQSMGMAPNSQKRLQKYYRPIRVAEMTPFSRPKVNKAIDELGLEQTIDPKTERTAGFTLAQVNQVRDHLNCRPSRAPSDDCIRLAVQSFKGGVSKSVSSVYLSQYLAEKGYRVLLIDCDPQASATSSFGFVPDAAFTAKDTLDPFIRGAQDSLDYAIQKTYFDGIDLIPSCLELMDLDFALFNAVATATNAEEARDYYQEIARGVDSVQHNYDVVIMDSSPNLSMMSINILMAANAVVIPAPPALYDFSSTSQYVQMIVRTMESISQDKEFKFLKVMPAKVDRTKPKQITFLEIMEEQFGKYLTKNRFYSVSAIQDTASVYQTVFDQQKPDRRVLNMLNQIFEEIELEMRKTWPSKHEELRDAGVIF